MPRRMTKWETYSIQGLVFGVALMVGIVMVDVTLIWMATNRPVAVGTFIIGLAVLLSLGLLGLFSYWLTGLVQSRYLLDRNELIIHWGPTRQVIPTDKIERVLTGEEIEGRIRFYGAIWPGHCVGYGDLPDGSEVLFYGTVPPRQQIYLITPGLTYAISPEDREGFLESLRKRLEMGPTQIVEQSSQRPGILDWPIWQDRLGLALMGVGVLAVLILTGLLAYRFPSLPLMVPLHFDATGTPDRFGPRGQIFIVALIGWLTVLLNGVLGGLVYRFERMVSYLLWGGTVLVQTLVWTAALGILGQV